MRAPRVDLSVGISVIVCGDASLEYKTPKRAGFNIISSVGGLPVHGHVHTDMGQVRSAFYKPGHNSDALNYLRLSCNVGWFLR